MIAGPQLANRRSRSTTAHLLPTPDQVEQRLGQLRRRLGPNSSHGFCFLGGSTRQLTQSMQGWSDVDEPDDVVNPIRLDCRRVPDNQWNLDRFFKKVGLSGKSIIPMVIGTGCAIPGVMATRTIRNERQRRTTAMLTPFMPCGAKLPVIALFAGVFFNDAAWVGTMMYFMGIAIIILGALIVVRITGEKNARSFFIMELPEYRFPSVKRAMISMLSRYFTS